MKICRIPAAPINLPLEVPYAWAFGELPGFSVTIVDAKTEDGLTGLSKTPGHVAATIIRDQVAAALARPGVRLPGDRRLAARQAHAAGIAVCSGPLMQLERRARGLSE